MNATVTGSSGTRWRPASISGLINALIVIGFASYWLLGPGLLMVWDLSDARWREPGGSPRAVWRVHQALTPRYAQWARARVASQVATNLPQYDVPMTEWPMFGSVFYLSATAALQQEWERDRSVSKRAPREYARETIEACTELILDPAHHTWVKNHWGRNYLHTENVFFRGMLIQGLTAREQLLRDGKHTELLRDQVETFARELEASRHGLLEDYPGECYPIDVFATIACIRQADAVLGTDHSEFVQRALRGFLPPYQDERGLVPYTVELPSGQVDSASRGIGMSYVLIYAPELYPEQARRWYELYEQHFWQQRWWAAGFREYPRDLANVEWLNDPDSGPVIHGFSPSGCAYGIAAARIAGRFDHAWTLAAQALTIGWPMPDGSWLGARFLSAASGGHAPYLGEANLLFLYTRPTPPGTPVKTGGHISLLAWGCLGLALLGGGGAIWLAVRQLRRWWQRADSLVVPLERLQFAYWLACLAAALGLALLGKPAPAMLALLLAQFVPRYRQARPQRQEVALRSPTPRSSKLA